MHIQVAPKSEGLDYQESVQYDEKYVCKPGESAELKLALFRKKPLDLSVEQRTTDT